MTSLNEVRSTTAQVMAQATHVSIDDAAVEKFAQELFDEGLGNTEDVDWDACGWHYCKDVAEDGPLTCQYIFVMDALNFCFWPTEGFEYEQLAVGLKNVLEKDPTAFDADKLAEMSCETLSSWFAPWQLPQLEERVVKLKEVGMALGRHFDGKAQRMVAAANGSAQELVELVVRYFPGFRDHTVYKGRQVFLYKRAQILVGDVWAAYGRRPRGSGTVAGFDDMNTLTMFADYRVPQLLRPLGILVYSPALAAAVDERRVLASGSEEEVELRAASIQAVEKIQAVLASKGRACLSIELDWLLWQRGEKMKDELLPHHRTLTVYY